MKRILVTGFEPFGGLTENPSWEAVRTFEGIREGEALVRARLLPVEYAGSVQKLHEEMENIRPHAVVCFGRAPDAHVKLERIARNAAGTKSDNAGLFPPAGEIVREAPVELATSLPLEEIGRRLQCRGIAHGFSDDAGGYVCNHLFYNLMLAARATGMTAGFIHVPPVSEAFPLEKLRRAVAACIGVVAEQPAAVC